MMDIQFFDDPSQSPRSRADVCFKQIGLYVYEDQRRVAFGVELTPFLERPCIEVHITNADGVRAGSLNVIETLTPNFTLTMHLRDQAVTDPYTLTATIYYAHPENGRVDVHSETLTLNAGEIGEHLYHFDAG